MTCEELFEKLIVLKDLKEAGGPQGLKAEKLLKLDCTTHLIGEIDKFVNSYYRDS